MFTVNLARQIIDANRQASRISSYPHDELLGRELMALVTDDGQADTAAEGKGMLHTVLRGAQVT